MAKKSKITKIDDAIVIQSNKTFDWYRSRLTPAKQYFWDVLARDLDSQKAATKHIETIEKLERYMVEVDSSSEDTVVEINWDVVATRAIHAG